MQRPYKKYLITEDNVTDQGGEFLEAPFQNVLKSHKIDHIIAYGTHKASYSERLNKTLENRLYKYFYENQTFKYTDILKDIVKSYNNTPHSAIHMAPAEVNENNAERLYERVYIPILNKNAATQTVYVFEIGDLVRLSHQNTPFRRGYNEQFTEELFRVCNKIPSHPPRYKVQDLADQIIKGSFYKEELQKVNVTDPEDIQFKIERVISTKTVNGQRLSLVKWYGYADSFNSYVPVSEIKQYSGKQ